MHFIDVGQADEVLIICDGHAMLINGGSSNDSRLDYIVAIHEDVDHVGGLRDEGATIYQTDLNGTVVFCSDGAHMTIKIE